VVGQKSALNAYSRHQLRHLHGGRHTAQSKRPWPNILRRQLDALEKTLAKM
jgi:hypothetical protein